MIPIRSILRKLGFRIHKGWKSIHPSGFTVKCVGCGEEREAYRNNILKIDWWETSESGDGSCGDIEELPIRWF